MLRSPFFVLIRPLRLQEKKQEVIIATVGEGGVGKSSLLAKIKDANYEVKEYAPTNGTVEAAVELEMNTGPMVARFVDTSGQEGTKTRVDRKLVKVDGAFVMYDSWSHVTMKETLKYFKYLEAYSPDAKVVVLRNKIDDECMSQKATYEKFLKLKSRLRGIPHYSVSVKKNLAFLDTWTAEKKGFKGKYPEEYGVVFHQEVIGDPQHGCRAPLLALLKLITGNDDLDFA